MAIIDRVKEATRVLLGIGGNGSNAAVLEQMFASGSPVGLQRGQWYPRHSAANGLRTQWEYVCPCGTSQTILEGEKFREYTCKCGQPFDFAGRTGIRLSRNKEERAATLRRFAGEFSEVDWSLTGKDGDWLPPEKQEILFRRMRPLPATTGHAYAGRIISTWDNGSSEDVEYEVSDPGTGGGFGNPR